MVEERLIPNVLSFTFRLGIWTTAAFIIIFALLKAVVQSTKGYYYCMPEGISHSDLYLLLLLLKVGDQACESMVSVKELYEEVKSLASAFCIS